MKSRKTLCAIPCFNESFNLPQLFKDLGEQNIAQLADIVFIDDCSTDETHSLIQAAGYQVIRHVQNQGYGQAVQTAFEHAFKNQYESFIIFPGDHQRRGADLKRLMQIQSDSNFDVVAGSKFHIYSEKYGPIGRRIGNRIYSQLAKRAWKSPIEDVLSGFKIYRTAAIAPFFRHLPKGYPLDICFSLYASRFNLSVTEIPVDCRYDEHTSKMKSVVWISLKMLMHVSFHFAFQKWICPNPLPIAPANLSIKKEEYDRAG